MKRISETLYILMVLVAATAQAEDCRVLQPEGAIRYEGECAGGLAHGRGKATVPSQSDPNAHYEGQFKNGVLDGKATYIFARGRSRVSSVEYFIEYFIDGKLVSREAFAAAAAHPAWVTATKANTVDAYTQFIKEWPEAPQVREARANIWQLAYEPAKRTNTVDSYTQFIKDWPEAPQVMEARSNIWQLAFEQAKRANTIAAYKQFRKDWPDVPQAKEAHTLMWQLAYDPVKRANTVAAYTKFIKEYGESNFYIVGRDPFVNEASDRITSLLESPIREAESAYKCEEARQLDSKFTAAGMSSIFDFDACADKRKFHNALNGTNPQTMYLAGVKYENDKERGRAKRIYLTIMDRFSEHAMALKAADRLAGLNDVEAVEDAQARTRQAVEDAQARTRQTLEQASRDAANRQDRARRDFCSGKSDCNMSCVGLRDDAWSRCHDRCNAQYSGC